VKLGLVLPMFSGDAGKVRTFAQRAESLGFDGVFAFDHFFPPGRTPDRPSLEAFTTLGTVGAATSRVTVGTLVTRAQLRPAGMLAKMAATLDDVTGGRMVLGIGTGDPIDQPEHDAFGFTSLGVADRRAHLAETLEAVQSLFAGRPWRGGAFVPAMEGPLAPPPIRSGGPPVWVGAQADEVVRLAGRLADGWNGWGMDASRFATKASLLAEAAAEAGREDVEATWAGIALLGSDEAEAASLLDARRGKGMGDPDWHGTADGFRAFLEELEAAGASWAIVVPAGPADRLDLLASIRGAG
jgi:alkanesulfonate monooxygenase SsuD/methylene tetrahydromethanopterin reductase-like flavin-dependent oxidoreductase (luciferase family)